MCHLFCNCHVMSDIIDLILCWICTISFYFLSNYYTFNVGTSLPPSKPLHDVFHDMLPNLSEWVTLRDYILPIFFIPLLLLSYGDVCELLLLFCEGFMYIVTLKAITIFFTFLPPSNTKCAEKKQINHCFHQIFSGHNSFVLLLCILYLQFLPWNKYKLHVILICISTFLYSMFILMTRAHYSVDVILSYIIVILLCTDNIRFRF